MSKFREIYESVMSENKSDKQKYEDGFEKISDAVEKLGKKDDDVNDTWDMMIDVLGEHEQEIYDSFNESSPNTPTKKHINEMNKQGYETASKKIFKLISGMAKKDDDVDFAWDLMLDTIGDSEQDIYDKLDDDNINTITLAIETKGKYAKIYKSNMHPGYIGDLEIDAQKKLSINELEKTLKGVPAEITSMKINIPNIDKSIKKFIGMVKKDNPKHTYLIIHSSKHASKSWHFEYIKE